MPSPSTIRATRLALGLTQAQAGALVGASARAWRYWEGGGRKMGAAVWYRDGEAVITKEDGLLAESALAKATGAA